MRTSREILAFVAISLFAISVVSPSAIAGGHHANPDSSVWVPPYNGFSANPWTYAGDFSGTYEYMITQGPSISLKSGKTEQTVFASAFADGYHGSVDFSSSLEIRGKTFTQHADHLLTMTYHWKVQYRLGASTLEVTNPGAGPQTVEVWLCLVGDLYDQTTSSWVVPGHKVVTVAYQKITGGQLTMNSGVQNWDVAFTARVYGGHVYELITWEQSEVRVACDNNGGGSGNVLTFTPYGYATCYQMDFLCTPLPQNVPPTAAFSTTTSGLTVNVDGSASSDSDGTISTYAWNWGDGAVTPASSVKTASHTYAAAGTYTIQLTVTDNLGATGTKSLSVTVPPVVTYTLTISTPPGCPTPKAGSMSVLAGTDVTVYACGGYNYGLYTYVFSRWKLDTTDWYSTASSVVVHMDKAHTITAVFDRYLY